jgi:hypothetical protein
MGMTWAVVSRLLLLLLVVVVLMVVVVGETVRQTQWLRGL